jgi:hypothetical protein
MCPVQVGGIAGERKSCEHTLYHLLRVHVWLDTDSGKSHATKGSISTPWI